jgi:carboxypeptidase family protein/TonB-dependent receptor-like protein
MLRRNISAILLTLVFAGLAPPAFAQAGRSEINGSIVDTGKAVLPGVTITVTNEETGLERTAVSSGEGTFVIPTLVPGRYTIKAELSGFSPTTQRGIVVNVGQELTVDLTLQVAGVQENITVTGQAPLVEATSSRIGTNITNAEIDSLPSQGRNQLSLMQMVPGLVPTLSPGSFEGGQYNAAGQATSANVFVTDGAYNNDSRRGGSQGTQASVALDAMAEYQVLSHQYNAEYGGGMGVVVNAVTKSGTNQVSGRVFEYLKHNKLDATDYFLKLDGEENPPYKSNVFGGNVGGPIVRNRAFYFVNVERTLRQDAANIRFPANAAPLAVSYSDTQDFTVFNSFARGDVQLSGNQNISVRWLRAHELTEKDTLIESLQVPSNWRHENDAGDQVFSVAFTSIFGSHATNELRVGHTRESLLQGSPTLFDDNWKFIGLNGRDQYDLGSQNTHPDFTAGPNTTFSADLIRDYTVDDAFTYFRSGWGGDHSFKMGFGYSSNGSRPQTIGGNANGTFNFSTNQPFDAANPFTYPRQFTVRVLGRLEYEQIDHRTNFFVQDKWQLNRRVTLNLGMRYDYQTAVPQTKNAVAPRLGLAFDVAGDGRTVIRAGTGKFYQIQGLGAIATFLTDGLFAPIFQYTTGPQLNPAPSTTGVIPTNVCLQPAGNSGLAQIGPACRALLNGIRTQLAAGAIINTTNPTLDGDRVLPYIWGYSAGIERVLAGNMAVSVDYVGNVGRDQTTLLDINVGPTNPATGRITRLGVNGFDPTGTLIPAGARNATFSRVLTYFTDDRFNTDYNSLEVALEKRHANRWSGRVAYTLAYANAVSSITDQLNPRADYGRSSLDNRHALAMSANIDVWRGLAAGFVFRTYSGRPINETIGTDVNADENNNDRPIKGVHDQIVIAACSCTRPILSPVDANGRAIPFGIDGEKQVLLDGRLQYLWRIQQRYQAGLFWELYNLTNQNNFGNPTGARNSANYMVQTTVGAPRSMQLGFRLTF